MPYYKFDCGCYIVKEGKSAYVKEIHLCHYHSDHIEDYKKSAPETSKRAHVGRGL